MNELSVEYKTAVKLNQKIIFAAQMAQKNLYDMCMMLKEMRDNKLYKELGYQNFEEYCEQEVGISRHMAYKYTDVVSIKNVESIQHFGITKLSLLASLSESQQEEIQEKVKVEDVSVRELKEEIKKLKEDKEAAEKKAQDEITNRIHLQSDVLSLKSKNRSLSHELEETKKNMNPDTKVQNALIRDLDKKLSVSEQEHANKMEEQRKKYQAKINELQEQLDSASSIKEVAVETVEVPATKEIFEAYSSVVKNAFDTLLDFIDRLESKKEYAMLVDELLNDLNDELFEMRREEQP